MRVHQSFRGVVTAAIPLRIPVPFASCLIAAALAAHVEPAQAQTVAGRITAHADGMPLEGVYVYVTTEAGAVAAAGLSDARGMFALRAPMPGRYDLHAELIGHEPAAAGPLLLLANATERRDLVMTVRAIDLAAITVQAESRCRSGPPAAPVTQALWEEARTALRVTRWTQETAALRFGLVRTRRQLDPVTLDVKSEQTQTRSGYFAGSPYVALTADRLAEHGFVTHADDGGLEYWAPDATVLLSESFLDTHCFNVAAPTSADPGLVGLAFEPVSGRGVPEIEGVLWIRAETAELVRLDFRYVNLPFATRTRWDEVGGRVEFERLANGMWIVRRWRIRMPVVESRRRTDGVSSGYQLVLAELSELGGEVLTLGSADWAQAVNAASSTSADSLPDAEPRPSGQPEPGVPSAVQAAAVPAATDTAGQRAWMSGTVTGSVGPAAGVLILLSDSTGTRLASAVTNDDGNFRLFHAGRDGAYRLTAEHIGYASTVRDVTLRRGETITVDVQLASTAVRLGEIRVTARRQDFLADAGFYDRMERGLGWFVDSEQIDRRMPSRITDLLQGAPGVQVISQGAFGADIRIFEAQRLRGDCPPAIYIDGLQARAYPRSGPPLTELVDVASVAALEVLRRPTEIPARYRGSQSACGVVLVWLKR